MCTLFNVCLLKSNLFYMKKGVKSFSKARWTKNYLEITELFEVKQIGIRDN